MEKFSDLKAILDQMNVDIEKFYQKNQNAAGTRLRKSLNELRKESCGNKEGNSGRKNKKED